MEVDQQKTNSICRDEADDASDAHSNEAVDNPS